MNEFSTDPSLEGTWQMVRAEHAGAEAPQLVAQRTLLEFTRETYLVRFDGDIIDQGRVEVIRSNLLKTVLLFGTSGPNRGRTLNCIYQQVGDRLRICYGLDGVQPSEFSTKSGQNRYLAIYRRKTP
ncbi:MAG TPA: TIGR03067 domain-containing protein [Opitutus sp.]|nr:TIGR03067 domain-containing protein [Opitutus sp.]